MKVRSNKKAPNFKLPSTSSKTFELSKLKVNHNNKPKMIIAGASAYPRIIDFD